MRRTQGGQVRRISSEVGQPTSCRRCRAQTGRRVKLVSSSRVGSIRLALIDSISCSVTNTKTIATRAPRTEVMTSKRVVARHLIGCPSPLGQLVRTVWSSPTLNGRDWAMAIGCAPVWPPAAQVMVQWVVAVIV